MDRLLCSSTAYLRGQKIKPLFTDDSLFAKLIVWTESCRMSTVCWSAAHIVFLKCVHSLALLIQIKHKVHGCSWQSLGKLGRLVGGSHFTPSLY